MQRSDKCSIWDERAGLDSIALLKVELSLAGEDCQHAVTDEALCMVTGCAVGTDVCHWMFKTKVNMVQGQQDGPLNTTVHILTKKRDEEIKNRLKSQRPQTFCAKQ